MFNSAVSVVRVVFCHKQVEKNHLVLPAHIFVLCSKTPKTSGALPHRTASLEGKTPVDISAPPPLKQSSCKASVFLHSNMLMPVLSPPMKPASVMMPALAPAVTFQRLFSSVFLLFFLSSYVHVSILWGRRRWWITVHFIGSQIKVLNFERCVLTRLYL